MKKYALITAGGTGSRMQSAVPKQFLLLKDKPILMHTIQVFHDVFDDIIFTIVLPEEHVEDWNNLCDAYNFDIDHTIVVGGEERFNSVKNGLESLKDEGIVAIHDAVRPLVYKSVIRQGFDLAEQYGNAVPCIGMNESIREITGEENRPVDRNQFRIIQTPQVFDLSVIKKAYDIEFSEKFTDDATVLEAAGVKINLYKGNRENIKITRPDDMLLASALLKS